ncbi:chemotaxis protein MotB [Flavobacterium croceum DSM 17960]|uniref:Chemotaxis protein MotB n=1 Tax=Flavobacterium croceum DSM 17960 TaxID=1121886 RepID=A0A2S4N8E9_9FLAO|nr:OmpA family protein [Flavobacterium croceum]POS01967.1 chemotaxis protein MotB [Flavobacterium croceum DSM 17960]
MKRVVAIIAVSALALTSCGTKKKIADLETKNKECQDLLNTATMKLNLCLSEKEKMNEQNDYLKKINEDLKKNNADLINNVGNMTTLTQQGAANVEKALESIKEKDLKISRLQDALTKKDSVTLALVTSLKKSVGLDDPDINVNVEKGVVFINISDKMLFKSGSYVVTNKAKEVLGKVAKVINDKPDFECMVEGHTDNVPFTGNAILIDNWDLSVKRATAITRVLTQELGVNPKQLIAAGRSEYIPLVENNSAENRATNRRTRIVIMPKIDQFYDMIEKEMKNLSKK